MIFIAMSKKTNQRGHHGMAHRMAPSHVDDRVETPPHPPAKFRVISWRRHHKENGSF